MKRQLWLLVLVVLAAIGCAPNDSLLVFQGDGPNGLSEPPGFLDGPGSVSPETLTSEEPPPGPETLQLSMWLSSTYPGVTWPSNASIGKSLDRTALGDGNPPSAGVPVNGYTDASFDGTWQRLKLPGTMQTYTSPSGRYSGWALVKVRNVTTNNRVSVPLNVPIVGTQDSNRWGVYLRADQTIGIYHFVGTHNVVVETPLAFNTYVMVKFRYDPASTWLELGTDDTEWIGAAGVQPVDVRTFPLRLGIGASENASLDAEVVDFALSSELLTDAEYRMVSRWMRYKYALPLVSHPELQAGPIVSTLEAPPTHTYVGETVTTAANYQIRDGAKLHFFNGKYWLLGGWYPINNSSWGSDITTNQVLSSTDLVTWTVELAHDSNPPTSGSGARWTKRHTFGSAVWNGYLWVVGSDNNDYDDVWRSADGTTWERVVEHTPWGPVSIPIVTLYHDELHVFGGRGTVSGNQVSRQHWKSSDGAFWVRLPDMPFDRAGVMQALVIDDKVIIPGGTANSASEYTFQNDTWAWDGTTWALQSTSAPWSGRYWVATAVYDGRIWVLTGNSQTGNSGGAWFSNDLGVTWLTAPSPWAGSHADAVVATEADGIVMASGNNQGTNVFRLRVQ